MAYQIPDLDNLDLYRAADPSGAHRRLLDLAGQCRAAWDIAMGWTPPALPMPPRAVVVAGMGGSAIGGDLLRGLAADQAAVPILVHRDYGLPAFVGPHTLVLASSYSGNTEETISAAIEAQRRGAPMVVVATGGALAERAPGWGASLLRFTYPAQPREALGYSLLLLLGTLVRLDLLPDPTPDVQKAGAVLEAMRREIDLEVPRERNPAKGLAHWLFGAMPVIYGSGLMAPVARRWKGALNENSKSWAAYEELPEMDHNALSGTARPAAFVEKLRGIFLESALDHPRNRLRRELTRRLLEAAGMPCRTITARGDNPLAQVLSAVLWGDAASYYLAILYGVDPAKIAAITTLKEMLARFDTDEV